MLARLGYKLVRHGYYPPLGTYNYFRESSAKSGLWVKVAGYILVSTPLIPMYLLFLGDSIYIEVWGHLTISDFIAGIEIECEK